MAETETCEEIWMTIPTHQHYQVSNLGNVRSKGRIVEDAIGRCRVWKAQVIRPGISKQLGYPVVVLAVDRIRKTQYVHRMVWLTFKGDVPEGLEINHKDGDKANSALSNLELVSHTENMNHSIQIGTRKFYFLHGKMVRNPNAR